MASELKSITLIVGSAVGVLEPRGGGCCASVCVLVVSGLLVVLDPALPARPDLGREALVEPRAAHYLG